MFLWEWREFPSAPCLAVKENLMTARVSMLFKSRASLTCCRACFLRGRAKDLSAPRYSDLEIRIRSNSCCSTWVNAALSWSNKTWRNDTPLFYLARCISFLFVRYRHCWTGSWEHIIEYQATLYLALWAWLAFVRVYLIVFLADQWTGRSKKSLACLHQHLQH